MKKGSTYFADFADEEARKTVKGIPDHRIPLTPEGHRQAEITGRFLRGRFGVPDYVYHSGYRRTKETAEGILGGYSAEERARIQIRSNPFIRERHAGYTYDMTVEEAEAAFPWLPDIGTPSVTSSRSRLAARASPRRSNGSTYSTACCSVIVSIKRCSSSRTEE